MTKQPDTVTIPVSEYKELTESFYKDRIERVKKLLTEEFGYSPNNINMTPCFDNPQKPYYLVSFWDDGMPGMEGMNGGFATESEVESDFYDQLNAHYEDSYNVTVIDVVQNKILFKDKDFKLSVKFERI